MADESCQVTASAGNPREDPAWTFKEAEAVADSILKLMGEEP
jgi:hypothetical protein